MKINLQNNDEFDEFFRKKYAKDSIEPSRELWETIHQKLKFANISVNYHSISKLKIAVAVLAAALISTIIYFEVSINKTKTGNTEPDNYIEKTIISSGKDSINNMVSVDSGFTNENQVFVENDTAFENNVNGNKSSVLNDNIPKNVENTNTDNNKTLTNAKAGDEQYSAADNMLTKNNIINGNNNKANISTIDKLNLGFVVEALMEHELLYENRKEGINRNDTEKQTPLNEKLMTAAQTSEKNSVSANQEIVENNAGKNKRNKGFEKKHLKKRFSISIYATPQYSFRTLIPNTAYSVPDMDKTYFNEHEKGSFNFSAGVQLSYELNKKWIITTGVEYAQYSQKMKISSFYLTTDNQNGYYAYTSIGKDDLIIHSSIPISDTNFLESSKIYSFINIPVDIEYKLSKNFFLTGGISYNFLVSTDVNWQAEDYNGDFTITTNNITGIKESNFSFMIGIGYEQSIGSKFSFVVNPRFTTFITSFTKEIPVKTYPYTVGVKLGVKYKL